MTPSVSVEAELVLEGGRYTYRVYSVDGGARLVVEAPSLSALRRLDELQRVLPGDTGVSGAELARAGLTLDLQVRRATVAQLGAGIDGGIIGHRILGSNARVDPPGIARGALRAMG